MLRKDVDFVPLSPKKAQVSRLGASRPGHRKTTSMSSSRLGSSSSRFGNEDECQRLSSQQSSFSDVRGVESYAEQGREDHEKGSDKGLVKTRTTEEKKAMLGTMLGNVDALVEGVRKAGIWGLG